MTDQRDEQYHPSRETEELIQELGALLHRPDDDERGHEVSWQRVSALDARGRALLEEMEEMEGRLRWLRAEAEGLEKERGRLEAMLPDTQQQLMRVENRREKIDDEARELQRAILALQKGQFRASRYSPRPTFSPPRRVPHYLSEAVTSLSQHTGGSYWLSGEDARRRADALDTLVAGALSNGWTVALPRLMSHRGSAVGRSRGSPLGRGEGEAIALAIEEAGSRWMSGEATAEERLDVYPFGRPLFVGLSEFPVTAPRSGDFLRWLDAEGRAFRAPFFLAVSCERPAPDGLRGEMSEVACASPTLDRGRKIAERRLGHGWNRSALSKRVQISASRLALLELGEGEDLSGDEIAQLAAALGVDPDELRADERS